MRVAPTNKQCVDVDGVRPEFRISHQHADAPAPSLPLASPYLDMPGKPLRHGLAILRPFAGEEVGPVGGAGDDFAVGGTELEEHREAGKRRISDW